MYLITGMHRSGTSLVAQVYNEAGFDLGCPDDFYAADKWNVDGYFEQPEIHAVNMPLINGPFGKLSYFRLPRPKTILKRAVHFSEEIQRLDTCYRGKVVKETRFSLTLPAWLQYGLVVEGMVICLRHPYEVARSIKKRNHVPLSVGYRLWIDHNQRLLNYLGTQQNCWIRYHCLFEREAFIAEMGRAFVVCGREPDADELGALFNKCVKPGLKHHQGSDAALPREVRVLWEKILEMAESQG